MQRRTFLSTLIAGASAVVVSDAVRAKPATSQRYLRPPGAAAEDRFASQCIRCGQCAEVCPNRCIKYFGTENGLKNLDTPYITPRQKACILCMKCGEVCPTNALQRIPRKARDILTKVKMGKAQVNKTLCLSYQGKTCGVCYRACPLQDVAIRVGMLEQPEVLKGCVGCGLCERSCIQIPQAIRVIPQHFQQTSSSQT